MDKNILAGLLIGGSALGTAAGIGAYNHLEPAAAQEAAAPQFAEVISATPIKETYFTERQDCRDQVYQEQVPAKDENKIAGTAIGAIIGGVLGNQVGGGSGKKFATAAGAVAGAYAGRKVQGDMQNQQVQNRVEQVCETVKEPHERITGYQVSYRIGEEPGSLVMKQKPGDNLPVVDGKVVADTQPPQG